MADVDALVVKIQGDLNGLKASLREGDGATKRFATKATSRMDRVTAATGKLSKALFSMKGLLAGAGGAALLLGTKRALEFGEEIKNTAVALNLTTDELQEFRFAATQVGLTAADMDKAFRKFTVTTGEAVTVGGEYKRSFEQLGITLTDGQGRVKATGDLFTELVNKLGAVEDVTKRAAIANRLLGRQIGSQFNILVEQGADGLQNLRDKAHDVGAVMSDELATKARDAQDRLAEMDTVVRTQLSSVLVDLAPLLELSATGLALIAKEAREAVPEVKALADQFQRNFQARFDLDESLSEAEKRAAPLLEKLRQINKTIADGGVRNAAGDLIRIDVSGLEKDAATLRDRIRAMGVQLPVELDPAPPPPLKPIKQPVELDQPQQTVLTEDQLKNIDRLRQAHMTAQDAITKAQMRALEARAGNDKLSTAERIKAVQQAQQAEVQLAERGLANKLAKIDAMEADSAEAMAARDDLREATYEGHQLRLAEIAREGEEQRLLIASEGGSKMLETYKQIEDAARGSMLLGALGDVQADDGSLDAQLEALQERLDLEREIEVQAYMDRVAELRGLEAATAEEAAAKREAMEALEDEHEQNLTRIMRQGVEGRLALQQQETRARLALTGELLDNLSALTDSRSRKLFEIGKAAALANAAKDAVASTISSYRVGSDVGGPIVGALFAATAAASQAVAIQRLSSVQYGNRGGNVNAGTPLGLSGGTLGGGQVPGGSPEASPQQQQQPNVNITLVGDAFPASTVRALIEQIREQVGDGARLELTP